MYCISLLRETIMMVSLNKEIQYINDQGKEIYDQWRTSLELDSFNLQIKTI